MKKVFTILTVLLLTVGVFAQSPEKMSYQAVIRDASDNLVTSQSVSMQISILQGSAGGTAVYAETQTPTTNANGLVSIEIGGDDATVVTGSFSAIDWASGPYYIKTETDPTGGTSYTITGTNQLLSVPYALHAKTAETVTGTITETDPVYTASEAANITETDITNLGNLSGTNTGDQDLSALATQTALVDSTAQIRSEIPDVSGIDINTQAIQDTAAQIRADIPAVKTYSVGDFAQGGVVFYVDETGQHGLACAIEDQDGGSGIQWSNGSYIATEAYGDGLFAGRMNTVLIIIIQGSSSDDYAAGVCANYSVGQDGTTYSDWYLPSKYELNIIYVNRATIDATATANGGNSLVSTDYWSSTEYGSGIAWRQYFINGNQAYSSKSGTYRVRAVRTF